MPDRYQSWGRFPKFQQEAVILDRKEATLPLSENKGNSYLPYGNGRSYGDCCLNEGGTLLDARGLNRILEFDTKTGRLKCEGGVLLSEILELAVPHGWFLPVVPGTKFVTVGGAIANDVHGKNHHRTGTFGKHVAQFELLRSDCSRKVCSPSENSDWYRATIAGLGLTGVILNAKMNLKPIKNPYIEMESIRCSNLNEIFQHFSESDENFEYTVAWVDCLARGESLGRGLILRGNHASAVTSKKILQPIRQFKVPFDPPFCLINRLGVKLFNFAFYYKQFSRRKSGFVHFDPFFFPLDRILDWNYIYGSAGFMQYQCVIPFVQGQNAVRRILERITSDKTASFLTVLKFFGNVTSPGLLSFPRPGITLAFDFPNRGKFTFELLEALDNIVLESGGAVYPAKDARMSARSFQNFFPKWQEFVPYIDPMFSSSFWRRVSSNHT